jgi:hypothetical protein
VQVVEQVTTLNHDERAALALFLVLKHVFANLQCGFGVAHHPLVI